MVDLGELRKYWDEADELEQRLLREMTIQESLQALYELQVAFEWQLQQTESLFGPQRREYLAELQRRLLKLAQMK
jgi:hypothetical protein